MCETGKTYLVIGGGSGIGFATANKIAKAGEHVILVGKDPMKLQTACRQLPGEGHSWIPCDIEKLDRISGIFACLREKAVMLDGMVFSAGISPLILVKDTTPEDMLHTFSINLFSFLELVKEYQKETASRENSRIVAVASITANGAGYRQTLYGSSKAAMLSAVKLMSKELLNRKIRINCVSPGVTDTPMLDDLRKKSDNLDEKITQNQCLGLISPDSIADAIIYLLGPGADYMTGMNITVDGGAGLK